MPCSSRSRSVSIAGAVAIGIVGTFAFSPWIAAFVAVGAFIVVAYNLESFGGRFHSDAWFALAWGAFPLVTAYFAVAEKLDLVAAAAARLRLPPQPRAAHALDARCGTCDGVSTRVDGRIERPDGSSEPITDGAARPGERGRAAGARRSDDRACDRARPDARRLTSERVALGFQDGIGA